MNKLKLIVTCLIVVFLFVGQVVAEKVKDSPKHAKPGFVTMIEDGRLWIFREGSDELKKFKEHGELAKHVVRPGAGPDGMTVKAPDTETITDYMSLEDKK